MTSYEKNINNKKYFFKEGNNLISPLNNNPQKKSLNINVFTELNNKNKVNFPNINPKFNKLTPVIISKQNNTNINHGKNNITETSKAYSLSKKKNDKLNKFINSKYKLSKVISNDLSARINESKILEGYYNTKSTSKTSPLNSFKMETNSTFDNINFIRDSRINNKSLNGLRNANIKRATNDNTYNNIIKNEISSNDSNLASKRETIRKMYMKTDANDIGLNTPKNNINIKLVLPNKNFFDKKLVINCKNNDILATPFEGSKKTNQILLNKTTPENKLKITLEKNDLNALNEEMKLKMKAQKENKANNNNIITIKPSKNEHLIIESIGNTNSYEQKITNRKFTIDPNKVSKDHLKITQKNKINKCPEELHFYYISVLQEGKKNEYDLEGE